MINSRMFEACRHVATVSIVRPAALRTAAFAALIFCSAPAPASSQSATNVVDAERENVASQSTTLYQEPRAVGPMSIQAATLGANCGVNEGNITWPLSRTCDGFESCEIAIDTEAFGLEFGDCEPDLSVSWRCAGRLNAHEISIDPDAQVLLGGILRLACGLQPVELVTFLREGESEQPADEQPTVEDAAISSAAEVVAVPPQVTTLAEAPEEPTIQESDASNTVKVATAEEDVGPPAPLGCPLPVTSIWPSWSAEEDIPDVENTTAATARTITVDETVEGTISPQGNIDWFRFVTSRQGELHIATQSVPAELNLFVRVLDEDGGVVHGWQGVEEPGANLDLKLDLPRPGFYLIVLSDGNSDAASEESYELSLSFATTSDEHEPNNEMAFSAPLFLDREVKANILPRGDVDFYCLRAKSQGELAIEIKDLPEDIEPVYRVRRADGSMLTGWSEPRRGEREFVDRVDLPESGRYFIELANSDSNARSADPYGLKITLTPSSDTAEPNNDLHTSTGISLGEAVRANILPVGDYDFYRIDAPSQGALEIAITSVPDEIDPSIRVRYNNGTVLQNWFKAERGRGEDVLGVIDLPAPGTYYLEVADSDNDARSGEPYELNVILTPTLDTAEPNNSMHQATPLAIGESINANILPKGDYDWYRIDVPKPGVLSIAISDVPDDLEPSFRVRSSNGSVLQNWLTAERGRGEDNLAAIDLPGAGTYFIEIADANNDGRSATPYSLLAEFNAAAGMEEPNNRLGWASPIKLNQPVSASILPRGEYDWYRFLVKEPAEVRVLIEEMPEELSIAFRLRDANGSVVTNWTAALSTGEDNELTITLDHPGIYYLELANSNSDASSPDPYRLTVFSPPDGSGVVAEEAPTPAVEDELATEPPEDEPEPVAAINSSPECTSEEGPSQGTIVASALNEPPGELDKNLREALNSLWRGIAEPLMREALKNDTAEIQTVVWPSGVGELKYLHFRAGHVDEEQGIELIVEKLHGASSEIMDGIYAPLFEEIELDAQQSVKTVDLAGQQAALDTIGGGTEALYWTTGETYIEARQKPPVRPLAEALHEAAGKFGLYDPLTSAQNSAAECGGE